MDVAWLVVGQKKGPLARPLLYQRCFYFFLATFFTTFFTATFLAGAFFATTFFTTFLAGAFLGAAFLAGAFLTGIQDTPSRGAMAPVYKDASS